MQTKEIEKGAFLSWGYAVVMIMLSIMKPLAPLRIKGKSISTRLNGWPPELNDNVPSGYVSNGVSWPFTVTGDPTGFEAEFKYADILIGLPVPPGPGSWSSAVLKVKVMLVKLRLKLISRRSRFTVLGQRNRPENLVELITVEVVASETTFWTEKAGLLGKSDGELKCAVTPFDVWSNGVGWRT
jgi:hypothetical protein